MSLWKIAWRSMQQRAVASWLTAISVGFGVALVVAVLVIHAVVDRSFRRGAQGYDLIVGAKGSQLQLVLDTVFHLGQPMDTIPYSYLKEFTEGRFVPAVKTAIPVCTGHDYSGFRAVATVPEMFEELTYLDGRHYEFALGRNFRTENPFEAVVGYRVAEETGLTTGSQFRPTESAVGNRAGGHQDEPFTVVGVLAPTGTPNDRAVFLNLEGFYRCKAHSGGPSFEKKLLAESSFATAGKNHADGGEAVNTSDKDSSNAAGGERPVSEEKPDAKQDDSSSQAGAGDHSHAEHSHDHGLPEEQRRLTAILVVSNIDEEPQLAMTLPDVINEEPVAQAVAPARIIAELFDGVVGNVQLMLLILAVLVVVVAGIGILVSIYNSMSERRHDIAIMRALGASRNTVMAIILIESILLSLGGGLLGMLLGHGLVAVLAPTIADQTGVLVSAVDFQIVELILIPGLIALATAVGYLPALAAYRTDVARALTEAP